MSRFMLALRAHARTLLLLPNAGKPSTGTTDATLAAARGIDSRASWPLRRVRTFLHMPGVADRASR